MLAQLDLFAWASPPPAPAKPRATGFRVGHPCACGATHTLVYLDHPYGMWALRHWRISRRCRATAEMMAERHALDNVSPR